MKIFVTGASGFVGSAVTAYFVQQGHTVFGMSRSVTSDIQIERLGATAVRCDVLNVTAANMQNCDVLIHAAAFVGQWGSYKMYYDINVTGTQNVLEAVKKAGVKKLIYISTESVLINGQDMLNVAEDYPYPNTPFFYSKTKQLAEKAVIAANISGVFETVCLRPRMIWGQGDRVFLPLMKDAVLRRKFSWINGGQFKISTTHISNLIYAIDLAIHKAKGGSIYFVADDEVSTIRDFCTQLLKTQNVQPTTKSLPKWLVRFAAFITENGWQLLRIQSRPPLTRLGAIVFSSHCTLDTSKIKTELGYSPVISVQEGMRQLALTNAK